MSSKQIDAWSAEMKSCQAGGGDCGGVIKKYEELSTSQQKQLISDCAASPATCQQKYGDVLADSIKVKQAIDRALGEDSPIKVVYDLTATFAQQMQAEGVVATNKVSEALQKEYRLDEVQAGIVASTAASAFGGISKAGKGSALPTPTAKTVTNGLSYQSNPKHTLGQQGYSFNAGTEPKNSIDLFGSSIVNGKNDMRLMLKEMFTNLQIQTMVFGTGRVVPVIRQCQLRKVIFLIALKKNSAYPENGDEYDFR